MIVATEDLPNGVTRVSLSGRMDIEGAQAIDLRMNTLAGSKRALVFDFSEVTYIASMGLRTLITCARTILAKGGKIAIAKPQESVLKVLSMSGTHEIIAIHDDLEHAVSAVAG
jgi:anti-anti-sigma factor